VIGRSAVWLSASGLVVAGIFAFVLAGRSESHCPEPLTHIVPEGWEAWAKPDRAIGAKALQIPIPNFTAGGEAQLLHIRAGRLFVASGPLQDLQNVRWSDTSQGAYYSTQLHGLVGVGDVLRQTQGALEPDIAQKVGEHIQGWARCASQNREINPRAWYEGTVVKRQSNLLRALDYIRHKGPLGSLSEREVLYLLDLNATYLLDTPDVYSVGNHGIRQDLLLAATAIHVPEHPRADEMIRLAQTRLDLAARDLFTSEGIWKEHAPGYVHYALGLIQEIEQLHRASERFNPRRFLDRFQSSQRYLYQVLTPDGNIPYVGSSAAKQVSPRISARLKPSSFQRVGLTSFPDYGHAVVRGNKNGFYLLFVAGHNLPAGKRHADELSFLLYRGGACMDHRGRTSVV